MVIGRDDMVPYSGELSQKGTVNSELLEPSLFDSFLSDDQLDLAHLRSYAMASEVVTINSR
jgi:hypothetical protein